MVGMNFTLQFPSSDKGTTTCCADVPITDDQLTNEPVKAFSVSFVSISPAGLEGPARETCVFIEDDDGACKVTLISCMDIQWFILMMQRAGFPLIQALLTST